MVIKYWIETSDELEFIAEHDTWDACMAQIMEMESELKELNRYKQGSFCISEVEIDTNIPGGFDYLDRDYIHNGEAPLS